MRKIFKITVLGVGAIYCTALASEFRAPLVSERGPLRYDFHLKKEKWSLNWWSAGHFRRSEKVFLKHGTDTKGLAELFFGQKCFTICDSFEHRNCDKDNVNDLFLFQCQNPFLCITKFKPCISYTEKGMTFGGRFEHPICNNMGRVGVRFALPFKTVRVEREDSSYDQPDGITKSIIDRDSIRVKGENDTNIVLRDVSKYNLRLLTQLRRITNNGGVISLLDLGNLARFDGNIWNKTGDPATYKGTSIPFVVMRAPLSSADQKRSKCQDPCKTDPCVGAVPPCGVGVAVTVNGNGEIGMSSNANSDGEVRFALEAADVVKPLVELPTASIPTDESTGYVFAPGADYTGYLTRDGFDDLWAVTVLRGDGNTDENVNANKVRSVVNDLITRNRTTNVNEWLKQNCDFEFKTNQRTGLGDLDLDLFYEHTFNDDWRAEVMVGVRFPTAATNPPCNNPYKVALGNSGHFEVKIGGMVAWMPVEWMNIKADGYWSFVLEDKEKITTAFKGAKIKGVGQCIDADVDWGYFNGSLDFTFFHPKSNRLAATVGYGFYYKTEDNIDFCKKCVTCHCLGKVWAQADGTPVAVNSNTAGTKFADYNMALDNKVAERNTERIAHRLRFESSWRASKYLDLYVGGAYTFAGQKHSTRS